MKKLSPFTRLITAGAFAAFVIIGCKKENSQSGLTPQQEQDAASVNASAEAETEFASNDVFNNVLGVDNNVGIAGVGVFGRMTAANLINERETGVDSLHCFAVSYVRLNADTTKFFPIRVTIDFGAGCTGHDGHTRYGKIIATYTGRLIEPGKSASVTFDGYKIDSISVQGTHTIANTSSNSQLQFTIDVMDAKLSKPSGNYTSWNAHRTITRTEGNATPFWPLDDIFSINGTLSGKTLRGNDLFGWEAETSSPLIMKVTCPWIVQGVLKVRRETLSSSSQWTAAIDYGNGNCDNQATLTINGSSREIILH